MIYKFTSIWITISQFCWQIFTYTFNNIQNISLMKMLYRCTFAAQIKSEHQIELLNTYFLLKDYYLMYGHFVGIIAYIEWADNNGHLNYHNISLHLLLNWWDMDHRYNPREVQVDLCRYHLRNIGCLDRHQNLQCNNHQYMQEYSYMLQPKLSTEIILIDKGSRELSCSNYYFFLLARPTSKHCHNWIVYIKMA